MSELYVYELGSTYLNIVHSSRAERTEQLRLPRVGGSATFPLLQSSQLWTWAVCHRRQVPPPPPPVFQRLKSVALHEDWIEEVTVAAGSAAPAQKLASTLGQLWNKVTLMKF